MGGRLDTLSSDNMCFICSRCNCRRPISTNPLNWFRSHKLSGDITAKSDDVTLVTHYTPSNGKTTTTTDTTGEWSKQTTDSLDCRTCLVPGKSGVQYKSNDKLNRSGNGLSKSSNGLNKSSDNINSVNIKGHENKRTVPHLTPRQVALLQTSWKHIRPKMQDIGIDMFVGYVHI